ncbi:hypothetical protein GIS00_17795 [Nakamurella sp. YIM 132087]|uniref:Glycosyltransferase RgtA/B/C/D-like domain-containing protein n=1 Tax=Nakamurella alba TaxID=2665158 RepID=A0A7K1FNQ6_9ACTN|nr:glycosyltransferase family 39 protein [Nakamurella alba]MTD15791.1 hypothetical protein [Nakamurella alba]
MAAGPAAPVRRIRAPRGSVLTAAAALAVVLLVTAQGYGYHRDELYFRMLPSAWNYVDQPPLTPWLARTLASIVDEPWFLRLPAVLCAALSVPVLVAITREVGGSRAAQRWCAASVVGASIPLAFGHVLLTATVDLLVWPLIGLLVIRALLRDPRWWLAVGALAGLSTFNKLLVAMLLAAVAVGLLVAGPRRVLGNRWLWAGIGIGLLLAVPNLLYQAGNDWPQLQMGGALADRNAGEVRAVMWPFLALLVGPPLTVVWVVGLVALWRRAAWRRIRALAVALPVLVVLTFVSGAQFYYPLGLVSVVLAIGWAPAAAVIARRRWRSAARTAIGISTLGSAVIALPLVPVSLVGSTPVPMINQVARDSIGWPEYVAQIAAVVRGSGPGTVVVTVNYGEAGAVARYGPALGITQVWSGHNALGDLGPPPESATATVYVGEPPPPAAAALLGACRTAGTLDNGVGVDNEEQGAPIVLCTGRTAPWSEIWPLLTHLG